MDDHTFELEDSDGQLHEYRVDTHPTREGSMLMLRLSALLSEPMLHAIRLGFKQMDRQDRAMGDIDIAAIMEEADLDDLGGSLRAALSGLSAADLHEFFAHSYRDGEPLQNVATYDSAYQGNWGEWMKALIRIIRVNGFMDFLSSMLGS